MCKKGVWEKDMKLVRSSSELLTSVSNVVDRVSKVGKCFLNTIEISGCRKKNRNRNPKQGVYL